MRFHAQRLPCGLLLLALAWTASSSEAPNITPPHDGQPGCGIRYEFTRFWRNNFIPEQYWECTKWQQPARVRHCPVGTRFQDSWQTCVRFHEWEWTPYNEPPTRPCEVVDECEEIVIEPQEPEVCPDECTDTQTTTDSNITDGPGTGSTWTTDGGITTEDPGTTEGGVTTVDPGTTDGGVTTEDPGTTDGGITTVDPGTTDGGVTTVDPGTTDAGTTPGTGTTADIDVNGSCPGASDSQHDPGTMSCFRPACTIAEWQRGTLMPTRDPTFFYQCGPGNGNLFTMPCAPGTCFSYIRQTCVHPRNWINVCA